MFHLERELQKFGRGEQAWLRSGSEKNVGSVLADVPYSVRRERKDDIVEYGVVVLNNMKSTAKVVTD